MGTVLNSLFGKGKGNYGDVEYWHGAERAGWLMKQGMISASTSLMHSYRMLRTLQGAANAWPTGRA